MEKIVAIESVSNYREVVTNRDDGTKTLFKVRQFCLRSGDESFIGEMTGNLAEVNKDTAYSKEDVYAVRGRWKVNKFKRQDGSEGTSNNFYIDSLLPL